MQESKIRGRVPNRNSKYEHRTYSNILGQERFGYIWDILGHFGTMPCNVSVSWCFIGLTYDVLEGEGARLGIEATSTMNFNYSCLGPSTSNICNRLASSVQ